MGALFGYSGPRDSALWRRMRDVLAHRGTGALALDEDPHGTIVYRGHAAETKDGLGAGLHQADGLTIALAGFLTNADAFQPLLPALLDAYRAEGLGFVRRLRGAFVLVIRDGATIHLVRDGAGARSLYYGEHDGRFLFAVEPKGVLAAPGFPRRIVPAAVARYLAFSFQPGADTMIEGLHEVLPGATVSWNGSGAPRSERYVAYEETAPLQGLSESEWVERFRAAFQQSVADRLPANGPVGLFLSGGIDSSIVAAELARQYSGPVKSYAIHFGDAYPHELEFAEMVAERCGTDHEEVLVRPKDFLPRLRKTIWHLDDPIGDPVAMPNFELAGRVDSGLRWIFNGEGGDPLFGGPKNLSMMLHHWYGGIGRGPKFREQMYLRSYRRAYEELDRLLAPEYRQQIDPEADLENILTPFFTCDKPRNFLEKLLAINIRLKGAHLILPKIDRMMGAWGLTPLSPLFDERLIQMTFEMPSKMKLDKGIEKVVLKRAYQDLLPEPIIARPKSGMRVPVHFWFQGELRRTARRLLNPKRLREAGIFNPDRVKQLLRYDTEEGPGRYGLRLWMLLTFEIWREIVVEGKAP